MEELEVPKEYRAAVYKLYEQVKAKIKDAKVLRK